MAQVAKLHFNFMLCLLIFRHVGKNVLICENFYDVLNYGRWLSVAADNVTLNDRERGVLPVREERSAQSL